MATIDDDAALGTALASSVAPERPTEQVVVVPRTIAPQTRMRAHIGVLLSDAYSILTEELRMLRCRVEEGKPLSESDARKFKVYTESLARLAREEREQEKSMDPSVLTDSDLLEAAAKARSLLEKGDE